MKWLIRAESQTIVEPITSVGNFGHKRGNFALIKPSWTRGHFAFPSKASHGSHQDGVLAVQPYPNGMGHTITATTSFFELMYVSRTVRTIAAAYR